jgi:hypothetical protein
MSDRHHFKLESQLFLSETQWIWSRIKILTWLIFRCSVEISEWTSTVKETMESGHGAVTLLQCRKFFLCPKVLSPQWWAVLHSSKCPMRLQFLWSGTMTRGCSLSYLEGRDQEDGSSKTAHKKVRKTLS